MLRQQAEQASTTERQLHVAQAEIARLQAEGLRCGSSSSGACMLIAFLTPLPCVRSSSSCSAAGALARVDEAAECVLCQR